MEGGTARRFRPMYACANMGHPSDFLQVSDGVEGHSGVRRRTAFYDFAHNSAGSKSLLPGKSLIAN
jgi:hypothetical protein